MPETRNITENKKFQTCVNLMHQWSTRAVEIAGEDTSKIMNEIRANGWQQYLSPAEWAALEAYETDVNALFSSHTAVFNKLANSYSPTHVNSTPVIDGINDGTREGPY